MKNYLSYHSARWLVVGLLIVGIAGTASSCSNGKPRSPNEPVARDETGADYAASRPVAASAQSSEMPQHAPPFPPKLAALQDRCAAKEAQACVDLAVALEGGEGVEVDRDRALDYLKQACEVTAEFCSYVGYRILGQEVANVYFARACEGNDLPSCEMAAEALTDAGDFDKALAYRRKACDAWKYSCDGLGSMYEMGQGVAKSPSEALRLYLAACDDRNGYACAKAGSLHERGELGKVQLDTAKQLYERGCENGHVYRLRQAGIAL